MILADTTIWVDHLRSGDSRLSELLATEQITMHAFVIAEIALGSLRDRRGVLAMLGDLVALPTATTTEVLMLIEHRQLFSQGIGFVDAALVASCLLVPGTRLWTRDRRLEGVAMRLGLAA